MARILIISPHGDDESLACAGSIIAYKGIHQFYCLFCTVEDKPHEQIKEFYGFEDVANLMLPDGKIDECDQGDIVWRIKKRIAEWEIEKVWMPYIHDIHSDHRLIAQATLAATKPFRSMVNEVRMYEVISQTNLSQVPFMPNVWQKLSKYEMEMKRQALNIYGAAELPEYARSWREVEALAIYRGSQINEPYAEAFQLVRQVV